MPLDAVTESLELFDESFLSSSPEFDQQVKLLKRCLKRDLNLAEELAAQGKSYDDLRYRSYPQLRFDSGKYLTLDDFRKPDNGIPVVSFFAGCGGLDLGFEAAGFSHLALVEHNELFCNTLRLNRPEWDVIGPPNSSGDVSRTDELIAELRQRIGRAKQFPGVFVGGPPCQPFSIAANQRFSKNGENFKRVGFKHEKNGNLLFNYIELIEEFRPAAFIIENVTGLVEVDGGEQLRNAYARLEAAGYSVEEPYIVKAAEHHIPQQRIRLFVIGSRRKGTFKRLKQEAKYVACMKALEKPVTGNINHAPRNHNAESILRYMELGYGGRDQLGRVDRLDPSKPSKTVIAGGANGGGRSHLHPYIPRTLSVRESARLQTFPDDYIFTGPSARQFTQVGNAVPPLLAVQLAIALKDAFF